MHRSTVRSVDLFGSTKRNSTSQKATGSNPSRVPSSIKIKDFIGLVNPINYGNPTNVAGGYGNFPYSSHNLQEGTNAIEDAVIRNARAAQDLYNSGVSVADYMAHSVS